MKKGQISVRIENELKQYLELWAIKENRSFSNLVETILAEAAKRKEEA